MIPRLILHITIWPLLIEILSTKYNLFYRLHYFCAMRDFQRDFKFWGVTMRYFL